MEDRDGPRVLRTRHGRFLAVSRPQHKWHIGFIADTEAEAVALWRQGMVDWDEMSLRPLWRVMSRDAVA